MLKTILNNRYRIIKQLGHGGFGTTFLAEDEETNSSLCAIKRLNSDVADLDIAKKLFKREADTLLQLQEVYQVPKFIDYFEESGSNYIVEEYIEGSSLEDLIPHHWNVANIAIFLWDILSILQLLHSKNIVHRDIKPSNLIQRSKDNKFTIIDFGAVKEIKEGDRQVETCIYHRGYAPPEQMRGIPRLNSDIYALGMTTIELLTKEPPREIIRDPGDLVLSPESNIAPSWLIDILNKMVQTDFRDRYQSVEEVLKDLGQKNRRASEENVAVNNIDICETQISNKIETTGLSPRSYLQKFWYLPLITLPVLIIASEAVNPWLRTRYYLSQGNSLLDDKQPQTSLVKFQQVINLQRNNDAAWKGRGDALFTLGRYSGALEAYNKALAIEPENAKALNNKGKILYKQGELEEALNTYQQAIEVNPEDPEAWSGKGLTHMSMQQPELALAAFEQAQKIEPDEPNFWLQKGLVLRALQRPQEADNFYQEAIAVYDEVTAKEKNNPLLWTDRGFVLLQLNRPQDAFTSYDRALMLDGDFYEALIGKANAYSLVKNYQQALLLLDRAKEIRPRDHQVWYNRGNLLLQALENPQEAALSFEQATKIEPNFQPAWLGQGIALVTLQKNEDAKEALNKAIELNPQNPYAWFNLGMALEQLGEANAAYDAYKTAAIELSFAPAQEHLQRMQLKLGL